MPIQVECQACGQKLRVADSHAGKKAKCPKCQQIIQIPAAEGAGTQDQWHIQTSDGQQYGPISRAELENWVAEGRVDQECQLLQEGWEQWQWADQIFPELAQGDSEGGDGGDVSPFGIAPDPGPAAGGSNPFASPQSSAPSSAPSSGEAYTPGMLRAFSDTRPWVMLISILSFIGGGIGALVILLALAFLFSMGAPMSMVMMVFLNLLGPGISLWVGWLLWQYSQSILVLRHSPGPKQLEAAVEAQKQFWKFVGILTVIYLAMVVVMMIAFSVMGNSMSRQIQGGPGF